jgi:hypothetical protein
LIARTISLKAEVNTGAIMLTGPREEEEEEEEEEEGGLDSRKFALISTIDNSGVTHSVTPRAFTYDDI